MKGLDAPTMDVVIPTYNNGDDLEGCLDGLRAQDEAPQVRVFACVDGSTDDTRARLGARSDPFELVVLEHGDRANRGRAAARNLAVPHLSAPFVLFLDSDLRPRPDLIARHLALLRRRECVSIGDVVYRRAGSSTWARYQATRGKNKRRDGEELRGLDFNTQNVALARADLVAAGGFDESLCGYGGEDTELGLRLAAVVRKAFVFNAAAVAEGVETKSLDIALAQLDQFARTNLPLIRKRHPDGPAPFWIDRLESRRPDHLLLRAAVNPVGELAARWLLPHVPFAIQRRIIGYLVLRTVFNGYKEGSR